MKLIYLLNIYLFLFLLSCEKEKEIINENPDLHVFNIQFNINDKTYELNNLNDTLTCSNSTLYNDYYGEKRHYLEAMISPKLDNNSSYLRITFINYLPNGFSNENRRFTETEFFEFFSKNSFEYVKINSSAYIQSDAVVLEYKDENGMVWSSGDFSNTLLMALIPYPELDYNLFSFKIISSEKLETGIDGRFACKLKINIDCRLVNINREMIPVRDGNFEFIYYYPY